MGVAGQCTKQEPSSMRRILDLISIVLERPSRGFYVAQSKLNEK